jgi:hypothetical protein
MSWDPEFDDLLSEEVKRRPYTGQDGYGQPTFGASSKVQCRIVYKPEIIRRRGAGEATGAIREIVAAAKVYCRAVEGWGLRDQITLPDGRQPSILEVRTYPDEDGPHHQVVFV